MNESKWYIQRLKGHGKRKFVKALKLNCQGRTLSRDRFVLQRSGKKIVMDKRTSINPPELSYTKLTHLYTSLIILPV